MLGCHQNVPDRNIAPGIRVEDRTWRGLASAASLLAAAASLLAAAASPLAIAGSLLASAASPLAAAASLAGTHPGHSSTADHEFVQVRSFPGSGRARLSPKRA